MRVSWYFQKRPNTLSMSLRIILIIIDAISLENLLTLLLLNLHRVDLVLVGTIETPGVFDTLAGAGLVKASHSATEE